MIIKSLINVYNDLTIISTLDNPYCYSVVDTPCQSFFFWSSCHTFGDNELNLALAANFLPVNKSPNFKAVT